MNRIKRFLTIFAIMVIVMVIIPFVSVNTVKAEAGLAVTLLLFFIVNPIVSAIIGVFAGKEIKYFWFMPLLVALVFWIVACFAYQPAFPIVYSVIYFIICGLTMLITALLTKKHKS